MKVKFHKNKKIKNAYERYLKSNIDNILDCYDNPSTFKSMVEDNIREFMDKIGGRNYRIISYNSFVFTAGFTCISNGVNIFVYVTPYKTEYMRIS